jgi:hypothetical protein
LSVAVAILQGAVAMIHRGAVQMGVGRLDVHRPGARSALLLAMGSGGSAMAAALARVPLRGSPTLRRAGMGLGALLVRLALLPLTLILMGALLARSAASTTPSAASPSGFSGGTVRSTIHIVVTLLLCVTWTFLPGRSSADNAAGNPEFTGAGKAVYGSIPSVITCASLTWQAGCDAPKAPRLKDTASYPSASSGAS